jgi:phosphoribosyl 1,2-cyclic phosphodiesterase
MPFQFKVLRSGSLGNATLVWSDTTAILIDFGVGSLDVLDHATRSGVKVRAILITHAHGDHVNDQTIEAARTLGAPIFISPKTLRDLRATDRGMAVREQLRELPTGRVVRFGSRPFRVGNLMIRPIPVPHNLSGTEHCFAFVVATEHGGSKHRLGYATDLGCPTPELIARFSECSCLVLEANHDYHELRKLAERKGGHHWNVLGKEGHLSFGQAGQALRAILDRYGSASPLRHVVLAHRTNNDDLRLKDPRPTVQRLMRGACVQPRLLLGHQDRATRTIRIYR